MAATDTFSKIKREPGDPAADAVSISPSDSVDLDYVTRGIWVGGAGDLAVEMLSGATVTFAGVPAGTLLPIRVAKVLATGTTATDLVGVW